MTTEQALRLQSSLRRMREGRAPLPLAKDAALAYSIQLRRKGWTYKAITDAMGEYHGIYYSEGYWRKQCRDAGAPAKYPNRGYGARA